MILCKEACLTDNDEWHYDDIGAGEAVKMAARTDALASCAPNFRKIVERNKTFPDIPIIVFTCSRYKSFFSDWNDKWIIYFCMSMQSRDKKRKEEASRSIAKQQERNVLIDNCHN